MNMGPKSKSDAARAAELRAAILHHDHLYHLEGQSELSDAQYDALVLDLVALETAHLCVSAPLR
jgi:NAD-dependent DNA ligase